MENTKNDTKKPKMRLEWVEAGTLTPNPKNWRRHPEVQKKALRDVIKETGWAGALLYNERTKRLIDGHARLEIVDPKETVPVLVVDVEEEKEHKILATLDPLAAMARGDADMYSDLVDTITTDSLEVRDLLDETLRTIDGVFDEDGEDDPNDDEAAAQVDLPDMELWPYEHHDYLFFPFTDSRDWNFVCEYFDLQKVNCSPIPGKIKVGLNRGVSGEKLVKLITRIQALEKENEVLRRQSENKT